MAIMAGFLDLTRLLGRVMGSDLVLSVCNTCAGQYKVRWVTSRYNITPKMLKRSVNVTDSNQKWPCWKFSGPNSTSRTSYGVRLGSECL